MSPFSAIFVSDELANALSDDAWLVAMLDAERALANAQMSVGLVPAETAAAVNDALRAELYDIAAIVAEARAPGNPVEPLVRAIRIQAGEENERFVHLGATSQDILDTAAMLVARRALRLVDLELSEAADLCARLADTHRNTVIAARTLLQQAVPTTFGYKAASWLVGLVSARTQLRSLELPAQLGGAAGTLAALGDRGAEVLRLYAADLQLREPVIPWHTQREPLGQIAAGLSAAAVAIDKIARDIVLLAQTEVGEVTEADGGRSSTMPHKHNPVQAVIASAAARHARANAALLIECGVQEHERAAGAWHAEWAAMNRALAGTGGAAAAIARSLSGLKVDAKRMRANISADTLSEAHRLGIDASEPEDYLGSANAFIDRALALHSA